MNFAFLIYALRNGSAFKERRCPPSWGGSMAERGPVNQEVKERRCPAGGISGACWMAWEEDRGSCVSDFLVVQQKQAAHE